MVMTPELREEELTLEQLRAADVDAGSSQCRVCGCTDQYGCDDGCWWWEPDLCSSCARRRRAPVRSHKPS